MDFIFIIVIYFVGFFFGYACAKDIQKDRFEVYIKQLEKELKKKYER